VVAGSTHSFGSLLRRYRRAAELTQEELARRAGFNPNYISMLERGVRPPNQVALDRLAEVLGLGPVEHAALESAVDGSPGSAPSSPFGHLLREFRRAAQLTQEQLAERVNVSARTIGDLERSARTVPRPDTVELLIEALDLSAEQRLALEAVAGRSLDSAPGNERSRFIVPVVPTPLLGRAREEVEAVRFLRREGCRLLTLTGTGGVGKTRLAYQVAATVEGDYEDGVVIVPLAPLRDHALILSTIAAVLGLREGGRRSLDQIIGSYLRERQLLLLLDNFEHVLAAAPVVADLLATCSGLTVFVTSRAPLRLRGEQELEVLPFDLPDFEGSPDPDLESFPAVALFVQRAQAIKPEFRVTQDNVTSIATICRKVDGLPLAIELAAGWMRVMPPEGLLDRMEPQLQLLTEGSRDLPERQQTMRKTIAWSYDLLSEGHRRLFRRLSVFAGGCTLEAAEVVCREDEGREIEVLKGLNTLVDHSLVVASAGDQPRFSLLETIREYGQEQLAARGEADGLRQGHALYYLRLAELAASELSGPRQADWLSRLRAESDNFRAALAWWLDSDSRWPLAAEHATRLATALWRFWYEQGHWTEGRGWLMPSLAAGEDVAAPVRARALSTAGMAAFFQGEYAESDILLTESLALFRMLGSKHGVASALTYLGYLAAGEMDVSRTRQLLDEASQLLPDLTHPSVIAYLVSFLGMGHANLGDSERAIAFLEGSASAFQDLGDSRGTRQCLALLGLLRLSVGDLPPAGTAFQESLQLSSQSRDVLVVYFCLLGLAGVAAPARHLRRAAIIWGAADRLRHTHGLHLSPFVRTAINYDGALATAREQLGEAAFGAAWEEGWTMQLHQAIDAALEVSDAVLRGETVSR